MNVCRVLSVEKGALGVGRRWGGAYIRVDSSKVSIVELSFSFSASEGSSIWRKIGGCNLWSGDDYVFIGILNIHIQTNTKYLK